mmetsp:Transcript_46232/g.123804  ORF Transcript_46232/g.123804 Transcript_46232/m.123804 type:complete len:229 (+) Transcript_46232:426-1112(+)
MAPGTIPQQPPITFGWWVESSRGLHAVARAHVDVCQSESDIHLRHPCAIRLDIHPLQPVASPPATPERRLGQVQNFIQVRAPLVQRGGSPRIEHTFATQELQPTLRVQLQAHSMNRHSLHSGGPHGRECGLYEGQPSDGEGELPTRNATRDQGRRLQASSRPRALVHVGAEGEIPGPRRNCGRASPRKLKARSGEPSLATHGRATATSHGTQAEGERDCKRRAKADPT